MNKDSNSIVKAFLDGEENLTDVVSTRIYCPRLIEGAVLPAISFFTRGGSNNPHIPGLVEPSIQFDCWASSPEGARAAYNALYDVLQGVQREVVTIDSTDYIIWSAIGRCRGRI